MNRKLTVRQHYVQRAYLDSFIVKEEIGIYAYNVMTDEVKKMWPINLCVMNNMYEKKGLIDNRIEIYLKQFEDAGIIQIKKIIKHQRMTRDLFSDEDLKNLFYYVCIQFFRVKSNQLIYKSIKDNLENNFSEVRSHITNKEIKQNETIIDESISWLYDHLDDLSKSLELIWEVTENYMHFVLYKYENPILLTTDNPVYFDVKPSLKFYTLMLLKMPISPNILLSIEIDLIHLKRDKIANIEGEKGYADAFNEQLIHNANYWIMSGYEFTDTQRKIFNEQHIRMTK